MVFWRVLTILAQPLLSKFSLKAGVGCGGDAGDRRGVFEGYGGLLKGLMPPRVGPFRICHMWWGEVDSAVRHF